jgi:hypothetical protein
MLFLFGKVKQWIYDMEWSCNEIMHYVANLHEDKGNVNECNFVKGIDC